MGKKANCAAKKRMDAMKEEWQVGDECDVLFLARVQHQTKGDTALLPKHVLRGVIVKLGKTRAKVRVKGIPGTEHSFQHYCICKPKYLARPIAEKKPTIEQPDLAPEKGKKGKARAEKKANAEKSARKGTTVRKTTSKKGNESDSSERSVRPRKGGRDSGTV